LFSIVIPAHNESAVIGRCLSALTCGLETSDCEIIVVCNGCSDRTAEIARTFPRVRVLELTPASKALALNAGDRAARGSPIAYVDADVELTGADLLRALAHLQDGNLKAVSPSPRLDLSGSSRLVRAFYRVWLQLPYFAHRQMIGSGVYILSAEGRRRFGTFPEIISDDGYVRALFCAEERRTVSDSAFVIFAPRTLSSLIRVKTRVRVGNSELRAKYPALSCSGDNDAWSFWSLMLRRPDLAPAGLVYLLVCAIVRAKATRRMRGRGFRGWERDESSRAVGGIPR